MAVIVGLVVGVGVAMAGIVSLSLSLSLLHTIWVVVGWLCVYGIGFGGGDEGGF